MDDLVGKTLGQFEITELIGEGGMAAVYKAYQANMDRYIALKVLPKNYAKDAQFVSRFKQEARVIAQLEHAHILPVHDFGEDQGYLYIAMRLVETGTLDDLLQDEQPLPLKQIRQIFTQIGDALDYAHSRGIIHRDIKPTNVLRTARGNYLLTDFGIAKIVGSDNRLTQTGGIVGTPIYMSPEQGLGEPVDGRSDVYALGVMLYHMAVGQVPYTADTPMALVIQHIQADPPWPRTINPALPIAVENVIMKALAKTPEDRYNTADDMVQALQYAIDHGGDSVGSSATAKLPATAMSSTAVLPAPKHSEKRTSAIVSVGVLLFVVIAGVIALLIQSSAAPILYEDDFSNANSGWDIYADEIGSADYDNGEYVITVEQPNMISGGVTNQLSLNNVRVSVLVRNQSEVADAGFGITCNFNTATGSFYQFEVGSDQYHAIRKISDNDVSILAGDTLSNVIPFDAGSYQIEVICAPGQQVLYVNDVEVARSADNELLAGDIGLFVRSYSELGVAEIAFDDFIVTAAE